MSADQMTSKLEETLPLIRQVSMQFKNPVSSVKLLYILYLSSNYRSFLFIPFLQSLPLFRPSSHFLFPSSIPLFTTFFDHFFIFEFFSFSFANTGPHYIYLCLHCGVLILVWNRTVSPRTDQGRDWHTQYYCQSTGLSW